MGLAMMHILEPIPRILDVQPALPADCQQIIDWAMAKFREQRCPTATALATTLNQLIAAKTPRDAISQPDMESTILLQKQPDAVSCKRRLLLWGSTAILFSLFAIITIYGYVYLSINPNTIADSVTQSATLLESLPPSSPTLTVAATPSLGREQIIIDLPTETATIVIIPASLTPTPTQTRLLMPSPTLNPTGTAEPQLRITLNSANVRSGPGTNYPMISVLRANAIVRVLGRNNDGSWYNIELEEGQTGWLAASTSIGVNPAALEAVPVAATIPVPQTAAPSPTSTLTPTSTPPPPTPPPPPTEAPLPTPTITPDPFKP
jgi:hypothetical protein